MELERLRFRRLGRPSGTIGSASGGRRRAGCWSGRRPEGPFGRGGHRYTRFSDALHRSRVPDRLPAGGRPRHAAAGLRDGGARPRGSVPPLRRALRGAPPGRRRAPQRPPPRSGDPGGRAPPRHRGGHPGHPRGCPARVRRLGGPSGRGRHQAGAHPRGEPRAGAGREHPQDAGRHGRGHPGGPHQARRPPPQHAHRGGPRRGAAQADQPRDPGHLRPPRPPARHLALQGGAGGPGVRAARARHPQGDRSPAHQRAGAARAVRARRERDPGARAPGRGGPGGALRPVQERVLDRRQDAPPAEGF